MMDWRIGRLIRSETLAQVDQGDTFDFKANSQRIMLSISVFSADPTSVVGVRFEFTNGVIVASLGPDSMPLNVSLLNYGNLPMLGGTVFNRATDVPIKLSAFYMPEDYLAAGLEQFESEYSRGHS